MADKVCDHTSVGMLVRDGDKLLLIERRKGVLGFAAPAGHVDHDPSYEASAKRELEEEVGLELTSLKLVLERDVNNACRRTDGTWHHWKVYEVTATGELKRSEEETKQAGWYSPAEVKVLADKTRRDKDGGISDNDWEQSPGLEPVWYDFLQDLGMLN